MDNSQKSEITPLPKRHCVGSNTNEIFFVKNVFFDKHGKNGDIADKQKFSTETICPHTFLKRLAFALGHARTARQKNFNGVVSKTH